MRSILYFVKNMLNAPTKKMLLIAIQKTFIIRFKMKHNELFIILNQIQNK